MKLFILRLILSTIVLCIISNKYGIGAMFLAVLYAVIHMVFYILECE